MRLFTLLFIIVHSLGFTQSNSTNQGIPKETRILFILDGSGSMLAKWEGNSRINIAKEVLSEMIDSLGANDRVQVGLRVYGHQFDKKHQNCEDTKLEVGFSANNHEKIKERLNRIIPKGVTPIAQTLLKAANDFSSDSRYRNVIIIITDGIESCGGDPCEVSKTLQRKNIFLQPFIIGIGMEQKDVNQFKCMGSIENAKDVSEFRTKLKQIVDHSLTPAKVRVELLDINNKPLETNVNMSFNNSITGQTEYDFVHYIQKNGKIDEFEVDPVITYDIIVNTIPKVTKKGLVLKDPNLTIVKVKCPQGQLLVSQANHKQYRGLKALLRKKGNQSIIHHFDLNKPLKVLAGTYEIEILTTPRVKKTILIKANQTQKIILETPGILNIRDNFAGYGSLYQLDDQENASWIQNLDQKAVGVSMPMQPGRYKVVVRSKSAEGVEYTITKKFEIKSGISTNVGLL